MSKLEDKTWCYKQYWAMERSIGDIAKELNTYPNKVISGSFHPIIDDSLWVFKPNFIIPFLCFCFW